MKILFNQRIFNNMRRRVGSRKRDGDDKAGRGESEQNQPGAGTPLNVQLLVSSYYPTETPQ